MKKNKIETIKSVILAVLIISSLFLSYVIITYKPDYEIFTRRIGQKTNENQSKESLLNFVIPDSIVKTSSGEREEPVVPGSITKVSTVDAVKNKEVLKSILNELASTQSAEARVRSKDTENLFANNVEKLTINYSVTLESSLVKELFFSEENSNISLNFDSVTILKEKPDTVYLHKKDDKNYLQVTLREKIYDKIEEIFNQNKELYGKYSLNNNYVYLKEDMDNLVVDEYSVEEVNINKLAKGIFEKKENIRVSSDDEMTDGYAILKQQDNKVIYTNPSNEGGKEVEATTAVTNAITFLELGYSDDANYQITTALAGLTIFQQTYKDSVVFSKDGVSDIIVEDNTNGIYRVASPRKISRAYLSSRILGEYDLERTEYVINYLYKYVELNRISDINLGYEKSYDKNSNSCSYTPAWYVKYNDRYVSFKKLKEAVDKGERL